MRTKKQQSKFILALLLLLLFSALISKADPFTITGTLYAQAGQDVVFTVTDPSCFDHWGVTNGTIIGSHTNNTVHVKFNNNVPKGVVTAYPQYIDQGPCRENGTLDVAIISLGSISGVVGSNYVPCNNTSLVYYSVPSVNFATNYTWTYPSTWQVIGANNLSQIILVPDAATGGIISVNASAYGYSTNTVQLMVNRIPSDITGADFVCLGSSQIFTGPHIKATPLTYYWTTIPVGGGLQIIGSNTAYSVVVKRINNNSGTLVLTTGNACGMISSQKQFANSTFVKTVISHPCSKEYDFTPGIGNLMQISSDNINWTSLGIGIKYVTYLVHGDIENDYVRMQGDCGYSPSVYEHLVGPSILSTGCGARMSNTTINSAISDVVFNIFPNPANNNLNITYFSQENSVMNIVITDVLGNIVLKEVKDLSEGNNELKLQLDNITNGIYFVNLDGKGFSNKKKIVIEK